MEQIRREMVPVANGRVFEVLTCGPETSDHLAVCLHGFPEVAESWQNQMRLLASMGYRVWAPNQRGYGRSFRPPRMRDYAIEELMADTAGLIDAAGERWLRATAPDGKSDGRSRRPEERSGQKVVLLGHDWGAIVAWCFATRQARPLDRLVIVNVPHPACFARALRRHPRQLLRSWYALVFQLPGVPEWWLGRGGARAIPATMLGSSTAPDRFPSDLLEASRRNAAEPGALRAMIDWYRAWLRGGGMRRQMRLGWPVIEVPVLMLWGEEDRFLDLSTTHGTEQFARDLRLHRLPGVSHWVQQDAPEACAAELRKFLPTTAPHGSDA